MPEDFTQCKAWLQAQDLAVLVYRITRTFSTEERYGLVQQMRRAAVSVAANIAEGFGRLTAPDKKHKYVQARGELIELMTFVYYSEKVGYITEQQCVVLISKARVTNKIICGLIAAMKSRGSS